MTLLEAALLGVVQGVFMFVPVSSTSHLVLTQHWLIEAGSDLPPPESAEMILFDLVVHLGTLVSIAVVMGPSLGRLIVGIRGDLRPPPPDPAGPRPARGIHLRLALMGLLTVAVTGALGLAVRDDITRVFASPELIAGTLFITGALLWLSDHLPPGRRGLRRVGIGVAVTIGIAQGLALAPGLSRSGLTIVAALLLGMRRRWAAQYSFFVAIPTILAASSVQALEVSREGWPADLGLAPLVLAFVVAAVVGAFALKLVLALLYRAQFRVFAVYVVLLGLLVLVLNIDTAGYVD
jgi:undecaprenyl-diphosphatase